MGVILIVGEEIATGNSQTVCAGQVSQVNCGDCAVIVCEGAEMPLVSHAAGVMINGDSVYDVHTERVSGVQIITCGRGAKNTVSVTSDNGEILTLALNRAVETLCGICEPMELPVERRGRSDYLCMAEFAARILLGEIGQ